MNNTCIDCGTSEYATTSHIDPFEPWTDSEKDMIYLDHFVNGRCIFCHLILESKEAKEKKSCEPTR